MIVTFSDGTAINAGKITQEKDIYLNHSAEFDTGFTSEEGVVAEIIRYKKDNSKVYLVNGLTKTLDIVKLSVKEKNNVKKELETTFDENTDRIVFNNILNVNLTSLVLTISHSDKTWSWITRTSP